MGAIRGNDVEELLGLVVHCLQSPVRGEYVKPVGIKQINLPREILQRRKAARVPGNVECRSNSFFLVEYNLRRGQLGFAMGALCQLPLTIARLIFLVLPYGFEEPLLRGQQELGQPLISKRTVDK